MNDCGAVVNELMRKVMMNESLVQFDLNQEIGVQLRITQTRDVLVYLNIRRRTETTSGARHQSKVTL